MKAWLNLRHAVPERWAAFNAGLQRHGYTVEQGITFKPGPRDILVTWNRIHEGNRAAGIFEQHGLPVLVTENASWGNDFAGCHWYSLSRNFHNRADGFPVGDGQRWNSLGIELAPFRESGETVILPQRGIGPAGVAMPQQWTQHAFKRYGGRVRAHPGRHIAVPLEVDLKSAGRVITWGSGAAIKALLWGIPVTSEMPGWIGEQDNTDGGRLAMFRRLAWAQWTLEEIAAGIPFDINLRCVGHD